MSEEFDELKHPLLTVYREKGMYVVHSSHNVPLPLPTTFNSKRLALEWGYICGYTHFRIQKGKKKRKGKLGKLKFTEVERLTLEAIEDFRDAI